MMTLRVPAACGSGRAVICVGVMTGATSGTPARVTRASGEKPDPVIVIAVPPATVPEEGPKPAIVGESIGSVPTRLPKNSVNQRLPSGPVVMASRKLLDVGTGNSVTAPARVILPILLVPCSVNQRLPSG